MNQCPIMREVLPELRGIYSEGLNEERLVNFFWESVPSILADILSLNSTYVSDEDRDAIATFFRVVELAGDQMRNGESRDLELDSEDQLVGVTNPLYTGNIYSTDDNYEFVDLTGGTANMQMHYYPEDEMSMLHMGVDFRSQIGEMEWPEELPFCMDVYIHGLFTDCLANRLGAKEQLPNIDFNYRYGYRLKDKVEFAGRDIRVYFAPLSVDRSEIARRLYGEHLHFVNPTDPLRVVNGEIAHLGYEKIIDEGIVVAKFDIVPFGVRQIEGVGEQCLMFLTIFDYDEITIRPD